MEKQEGRQNAFGDLLKEFRVERGLTKARLAHESGLDNSYINRVERGVYNPPKISTIMRLSSALGLTYEEKARFIIASGRNNTNIGLEDFIWNNLLTMASRARSVGRVDIAQILIEATATLGRLETNLSTTTPQIPEAEGELSTTQPSEIQN